MTPARCATFTQRWKMAAPPWCWFPAARSSSALWTKCSDIAGATPKNSSSQSGSPPGFKVERVLKFNRTGVIAWWLNGKILRRRTFGLAQIRAIELADAAVPRARSVASASASFPDRDIPQGRWLRAAATARERRCAPMRIGSRNPRVEPRGHEIGMTRQLEETRANLFTNYKYEKILVLIFICTLPLVNPWVRGDGVGYYAFARALLIEHNLDFRQDWLRANSSFRLGRVDDQNRLLPEEFTSNGHLDNHFSIGPAMLWAPFLAGGSRGRKNQSPLRRPHSRGRVFAPLHFRHGSSPPPSMVSWRILLSFRAGQKYLPARWAFLGCLGIWFASSLPVYMYFNPSWSHAQSAFAVALFFWYWDRTRADRSWTQWLVLGLISGLMMDVYYVCAVLLIVPLIESLVRYWQDFSSRQMSSVWRLFLQNVLFTLAAFLVFLPTLIVKKIIYGSYLEFRLRPALGLHFACLAESVFFFRARPFQLDAGNSACGDWPVSSEKSRSRAEPVLPCWRSRSISTPSDATKTGRAFLRSAIASLFR